MSESALWVAELLDGVHHDATTLSSAELDAVLHTVAAAAFDPLPRALAGGRLVGMMWEGRRLRGRDRLTSAVVHYRRHVVAGGEWPVGTTLEAYLASARAVALDPRSAVLLSSYRGALQVTVIRRSDEFRGPGGLPWVRVAYRVGLGNWVTVFQSDTGPAEIGEEPGRTGLQWLRPPR